MNIKKLIGGGLIAVSITAIGLILGWKTLIALIIFIIIMLVFIVGLALLDD
jgi:hypothetical protein